MTFKVFSLNHPLFPHFDSFELYTTLIFLNVQSTESNKLKVSLDLLNISSVADDLGSESAEEKAHSPIANS